MALGYSSITEVWCMATQHNRDGQWLSFLTAGGNSRESPSPNYEFFSSHCGLRPSQDRENGLEAGLEYYNTSEIQDGLYYLSLN